MKLNEYLLLRGIPKAKFARLAKISTETLNNILLNDRDMFLSIAIRIINASEGKLTYEDLISDKIKTKTHRNNKKIKNDKKIDNEFKI